MRSYLFMPELAPAPDEYVAFTCRRAIWTTLGLQVDDMPQRELQRTLMFMRAEQDHAAKRAKDRS